VLDQLTRCDIKSDIKEGSVISYEITIKDNNINFLKIRSIPTPSWEDILLNNNETSNKIIRVLNTVVTLDNNIILSYIKKMMQEYKQSFKIHFLYTQEESSQIITINYIVIEPPPA